MTIGHIVMSTRWTCATVVLRIDSNSMRDDWTVGTLRRCVSSGDGEAVMVGDLVIADDGERLELARVVRAESNGHLTLCLNVRKHDGDDAPAA